MAPITLGERRLEPEWLDVLPAEDPRARRSRQDLRRVNFLMGHAGILRDCMRHSMGSGHPRHIVELGAGDGKLMLSVAQNLSGTWPEVTVHFVDQQDLVHPGTRSAFAVLGWKVECTSANLLSWARDPNGRRADIMFANLVMHHFDNAELQELFAMVSGLTDRFIAVEPRRSVLALAGGSALGLIGCNDVTRHDAVISVRAGFTDSELTRLWPSGDEWQLTERPVGLFSHLFLAKRIAPGQVLTA